MTPTIHKKTFESGCTPLTAKHEQIKLVPSLMKTPILTILIAATAAQCASAATRQSAAYAIVAEAVGAGGGHVSSARYVIDSTLGEIGGPATASRAPITSGHGFASSLTEVTNLAVSAFPSTLNEGAAGQLTATARLDDGTFADVTATGARWSVLGGPLRPNPANGLVQASNVFQNTLASVQASYLNTSATLGLQVLNVTTDDFGSYAGDGLDDAWQVQFFSLNNTNAGPARDPDGDGQNNRFEFVAGTTPTDAASRFNLGIASVAGQPTRRNIRFNPRFTTRSYQVEYRTNLASGSFAPLTGTLTNDAGQQRTVTDLNATNRARYYRVQITFDP